MTHHDGMVIVSDSPTNKDSDGLRIADTTATCNKATALCRGMYVYCINNAHRANAEVLMVMMTRRFSRRRLCPMAEE